MLIDSSVHSKNKLLERIQFDSFTNSNTKQIFKNTIYGSIEMDRK